jgi:hypothetical protein
VIDFGRGLIFPDAYAQPQYTPTEERQHELDERADEQQRDIHPTEIEQPKDPRA